MNFHLYLFTRRIPGWKGGGGNYLIKLVNERHLSKKTIIDHALENNDSRPIVNQIDLFIYFVLFLSFDRREKETPRR